ncbi:lachesin precursor, putative [Pediculus humanus corporis]|uniref:Lachesin, putative n=1 Tax=Pediculus humanus subsp. corporis TaxID=121224 RepID=E0VGC2_PEDHC|nr:lachesin precursor, putative [Pediculus humanus corporis]EEB12428.1 lachesin precursor, putative [Pediculus humanus corporis]
MGTICLLNWAPVTNIFGVARVRSSEIHVLVELPQVDTNSTWRSQTVTHPTLGFEPDFLYPLENVTIAQGRDAIFTCVVNNLGGYRVAWIKADTKAILAIHEHVITNNARLSVTHNDYNTWTLNIRGVRREDRGQYMCQVNTDPMKKVVIPPDIIYEETSGDLMVPEGGSAKLVCKARGHPKPKVVWRREDGGDIIVRGGTSAKSRMPSVEGEMLTLSKVTRSEMGAYLCIAANGVPPSVSKRMMLHVHFHPLIQVPNQLVGAPIAADVVLHCHVEASPKAINYWTRESGEMIISNEKYKMSETSNSYYSVQMRLSIKSLSKNDMGGYKCISKNSIGDAEGNIRLYGNYYYYYFNYFPGGGGSRSKTKKNYLFFPTKK